MKIGWLQDASDYMGGAELTAKEFREAAPAGVSIVDCPPGAIKEADAYVVHNCVTYPESTIEAIAGKPVVKYQHDMWPHGSPSLRSWILDNAHMIFCSPVQRARFPYGSPADASNVPPACRLDKIESEKVGECVWLGHGMNVGKGIGNAVSWANENQVQVDFIGEGPLMPHEEGMVRRLPAIEHAQVPSVLATYKSFLFLPTKIEPFGRSVVEAWAQGLNLIVNGLIGATWWIEHAPEALEDPAKAFWMEVERACK